MILEIRAIRSVCSIGWIEPEGQESPVDGEGEVGGGFMAEGIGKGGG